MRAAAILADQIELPILWMAKTKKALELREFHADVLRLLQYWATDDGVDDLVARTGELVKQAYPADKASWAMEAIVAPLSEASEEDLRMVLQGCCAAGVDVWKRRAAGSLAEDGTARPVTEGEVMRAGNAEGSNDISERKMGMLRYLRCQMHRLRVAGKEALIMLRLNKPLVAVKAGELGEISRVFALARCVAREEKKASGALVNERRQEGQEKVSYPAICEPKPCQTDQAIKAAATKKANKEKQRAMPNDVGNQMLLGNDAIMSASDQELGVLMKAWHLATGTKFSNGYYWPGAWPSGLPKGTGRKGSLLKIDKQRELTAVIETYCELKARALQ